MLPFPKRDGLPLFLNICYRMYIHKLGKTTSGFGSRMTRRGAGIRSSGASNHKRTLGNGIKEEVYTDGNAF